MDHKEGWVLKNGCLWIIVLEKTAESPLDCKEIKEVNPKGNQTWIFTGKADGEAEAPILWSPDKSQPTGTDPDAGKDWRQKKKRAAKDKMVGSHHWLNGHDSEVTPRDSEGQGSLAYCSQWGCIESDNLVTAQQSWSRGSTRNESPLYTLTD